jgi:hypothetical protein
VFLVCAGVWVSVIAAKEFALESSAERVAKRLSDVQGIDLLRIELADDSREALVVFIHCCGLPVPAFIGCDLFTFTRRLMGVSISPSPTNAGLISLVTISNLVLCLVSSIHASKASWAKCPFSSVPN